MHDAISASSLLNVKYY